MPGGGALVVRVGGCQTAGLRWEGMTQLLEAATADGGIHLGLQAMQVAVPITCHCIQNP